MQVSLCEITRENYESIMGLRVAPEQQELVVPNAHALIESQFNHDRVPLGIYDHERQVLVGLLVHGLDEGTGRWWLHHLMVDALHQHHGYAQAALRHLIARLEARMRVKDLYAQYRVANEGARRLGARLGFQATGEVEDDQVVVCLQLPPKSRATPNIRLRDVTIDNARACSRLTVMPGQVRFVASNADSLIQSRFEPYWLTKAIYNDDVLVGFVMYGNDPEFGWGILRLMIDAAYQGRGYGRAAMRLVLAHVQAEGGTSVGVSYEADNSVARRLYHSLGFVETGEQPFGEPFAVLALSPVTT